MLGVNVIFVCSFISYISFPIKIFHATVAYILKTFSRTQQVVIFLFFFWHNWSEFCEHNWYALFGFRFNSVLSQSTSNKLCLNLSIDSALMFVLFIKVVSFLIDISCHRNKTGIDKWSEISVLKIAVLKAVF